LSGDATFLQRLLFGWTRWREIPFSEKERTNVAVNDMSATQRPSRVLAQRRWTSAHAQGYFSATILEHMTFDGFTLSPYYRGTAASDGAQIDVGASLVLRVAAEGPARLTRVS
jgi:hypothetical protein